MADNGQQVPAQGGAEQSASSPTPQTSAEPPWANPSVPDLSAQVESVTLGKSIGFPEITSPPATPPPPAD